MEATATNQNRSMKPQLAHTGDAKKVIGWLIILGQSVFKVKGKP